MCERYELEKEWTDKQVVLHYYPTLPIQRKRNVNTESHVFCIFFA